MSEIKERTQTDYTKFGPMVEVGKYTIYRPDNICWAIGERYTEGKYIGNFANDRNKYHPSLYSLCNHLLDMLVADTAEHNSIKELKEAIESARSQIAGLVDILYNELRQGQEVRPGVQTGNGPF